MAFSSSSSNSPSNYDAFLNFRGEDTSKSFAGHLYEALQRKKISTFMDSKDLGKGARLSVLFKAIEMSKVAVVVFSANYASSPWCLKELARIMECMGSTQKQRVVPVFYKVEPAVIKYQTGSFREALDEHVNKGRVSPRDLAIWQSALTNAANLSGWNSDDYNDESELIEEITTDVFEKLKPSWKHDVFLNFCKKDTYNEFVSHLDAALKHEEISTFVAGDDKGNYLQQKAVDESGLSVVVFSYDYPWFPDNLRQLVRIMACMDKDERIVVVFYGGVEPSYVRNLEGSYKEAFEYYEEEGFAQEELQKWKSALAKACTISANWETEESEDAGKFVENICEHISDKLFKTWSKTI